MSPDLFLYLPTCPYSIYFTTYVVLAISLTICLHGRFYSLLIFVLSFLSLRGMYIRSSPFLGANPLAAPRPPPGADKFHGFPNSRSTIPCKPGTPTPTAHPLYPSVPPAGRRSPGHLIPSPRLPLAPWRLPVAPQCKNVSQILIYTYVLHLYLLHLLPFLSHSCIS